MPRAATCLRAFGRAVALAASVCASCGRASPADDARRDPAMRIVSLSPALTHTLQELGATPLVVGQTPWCGITGVPAVGSLEDRNLEAIAALRPTLIVRQSTAPDPGLDAVAAAAGARVVSMRLDSVADVRGSVRALAGELPAAGGPGARERAASIEHAFTVAMGAGPVAAGSVLFLYATDPPAAFGRGTYVDDLWTGMGGRNAVADPGYPALTPEDVVRLRPDAVVCIGGSVPAWSRAVAAPWIAITAPELLEPSARMLLAGPGRLREASERFTAARTGGEGGTRP